MLSKPGYLLIITTYLIGWGIFPVFAQEKTTILNTGEAKFTLKNQPQSIQSNTVSVSAIVTPPSLEIIKTGDRASAEPGDTVIYRLLIKNTGRVAVNNIQITDTLPLGLRLVEKSLRSSLGENQNAQTVTLTTPTTADRVISFSYTGSLTPNQSLNVAYAAVLTPDAIRGTGRNAASALGQNGNRQVRSNVATHLLRIRAGILSDCSTIIGRVFVDKNFDGEQEKGEPGVPNAVIFMDDGNRIVTDANGLFSLSCVLPGNRTATLDLSSLPGYTLAPNRNFIERNSQSRLVRLAPGSIGRINFGVTPAFGGESEKK